MCISYFVIKRRSVNHSWWPSSKAARKLFYRVHQANYVYLVISNNLHLLPKLYLVNFWYLLAFLPSSHFCVNFSSFYAIYSPYIFTRSKHRKAQLSLSSYRARTLSANKIFHTSGVFGHRASQILGRTRHGWGVSCQEQNDTFIGEHATTIKRPL